MQLFHRVVKGNSKRPLDDLKTSVTKARVANRSPRFSKSVLNDDFVERELSGLGSSVFGTFADGDHGAHHVIIGQIAHAAVQQGCRDMFGVACTRTLRTSHSMNRGRLC
ncbi:hypothetical protein Poly41_38140 [Novipirellula artificiosorum]|uniref:Uncharacterized protein n=1 Tax=Novipirellula artificiosorum TaxID=2528016 RepID=A0A5C6DKB0_9BACT|nr:hypothetical protein Poly41_38140 [Novipirellula artificiosorum]